LAICVVAASAQRVVAAHLLAVAQRLLQRLDDQRRRRGDDGHLGNAVLHRQLDGDAQPLPVLRRLLGDVFSDLLGRQTERTCSGKGGERVRRCASSETGVRRSRAGAQSRHGASCRGGARAQRGHAAALCVQRLRPGCCGGAGVPQAAGTYQSWARASSRRQPRLPARGRTRPRSRWGLPWAAW
jgi:hypothetical protein